MRRDCQWSIRERKIDWRFREYVYVCVCVWLDIRTIGEYKSYVYAVGIFIEEINLLVIDDILLLSK